MKKFLITIFIALLAVVSLAGCNSSKNEPNYKSAKDGEWTEIQSITYYTNHEYYASNSISEKHTLTSNYTWEHSDIEYVNPGEYLNAIENQEIAIKGLSGDIDINKSNLISNPQKYIDKVYYFGGINKATLKKYNVYYVKARFLDDSSIEINYYESSNDIGYTTIRVKPLSYTVTYFNT